MKSDNWRRQEFLDALATVCKKYGLAPPREDGRGALTIDPLDDQILERLNRATYYPGVSHGADAWIVEHWMGKRVEQTAGPFAGPTRHGVVKETMWDEKGALHCSVDKADGDYFWCPASLLVQK